MNAENAATGGSALRLEGLDVRFQTPRGEVHAVRDLTLSVEPSECLGIVGESGAGKSQAFLAVLGLLAANGRVGGRARFGSVELLNLQRQALDRIRGPRIGMVFQDPMTSLTPHLRIGEQIAEPLVQHTGIAWTEARRQALDLLHQVHVTDAERRMTQYPHELSGGMRQRVMIAIAICCRPDLLIADEPTTALDVTIQAQILALLVELKHRHRMAMILITHDLGAVAGVADRVAVMRAGALVESAPVGVIFKSPSHSYTRSLLAAVPRIDVDAPVMNAAIDRSDHRESHTNGQRTSGGDAALRVTGVDVAFEVSGGLLSSKRSVRALSQVSLELRPAEALGVVGESGSGKSTLARAILRLLRMDSGEVVWLGRSVQNLSQRELQPLRANLQMVFQDPVASLDPRMTALQIVTEPLTIHRPQMNRDARSQTASAALQRVGLTLSLAHRYPHELSGGQCQRVGIARAMVLRPRLLICDEPVSALDVTVQQQVLSLLANIRAQEQLAILFISHNLAVVRNLCERVLVLYLGRMMESAPTGALFGSPLHPYTRELLNSAPIPDPDVQPARLARGLFGEAPSPLSPPSGCVYRTRCPHAIDVCREQVPRWESADEPSRQVACHRWRELAPQACGILST